jgi:hypothetical protein
LFVVGSCLVEWKCQTKTGRVKGPRCPEEFEESKGRRGRPFKAPRTKTVKNKKVVEEQESIVQVIEKESVTDKDVEETKDRQENITKASDKTPNPPDFLKSPETIVTRIPGSVVRDRGESFDIESRRAQKTTTTDLLFKGVTFVPETENQDGSSGSEDDISVVRLLGSKTVTKLTSQQIQDCTEGPKGEKAIGVTVAKLFDGVEYRGIVDKFRTVRNRLYYHVTYADGDEEELSQIELRDNYLLGLSPEAIVQKITANEARS